MAMLPLHSLLGAGCFQVTIIEDNPRSHKSPSRSLSDEFLPQHDSRRHKTTRAAQRRRRPSSSSNNRRRIQLANSTCRWESCPSLSVQTEQAKPNVQHYQPRQQRSQEQPQPYLSPRMSSSSKGDRAPTMQTRRSAPPPPPSPMKKQDRSPVLKLRRSSSGGNADGFARTMTHPIHRHHHHHHHSSPSRSLNFVSSPPSAVRGVRKSRSSSSGAALSLYGSMAPKRSASISDIRHIIASALQEIENEAHHDYYDEDDDGEDESSLYSEDDDDERMMLVQ